MLEILSNEIGSLIALLAALGLMALAVVSGDRSAKVDLRSAIYYLVGYVLTHFLAATLSAAGQDQAAFYVGATSYVLFAFGAIRGGIGLLLWGARARRGVVVPKIVHDVAGGFLYFLALAIVLRSTLKIDLEGLVATSAVLSVVIGLASQETLGNLFAGLALQLEPPFRAGDDIAIGDHKGTVLQVGWRATRILSRRGEEVSLPNSVVGKESVTNYSRAGEGIGRDLLLQIDYEVPPTLVKTICHEVVASHAKVLRSRPPDVQLIAFADSGVEYRIRFFTTERQGVDAIADEILSMLWYRLKRENVAIPFPTRTVHMIEAAPAPSDAESIGAIVKILTEIPFLRPLGTDGLASLARLTKVQLFGRGETIIRQGDAGEMFYVIVSGAVLVQVRQETTATNVAELGAGAFFGEMSLLTGEPRSATVVATSDCRLLCADRRAFGSLLGDNDELARALSDALAERSLTRGHAEVEPTKALKTESSRILDRVRELFRLEE